MLAAWQRSVDQLQLVGAVLWTKSKSRKALKLRRFDAATLIKAAKYGSLPVVKHLTQLPDYPRDPALLTPADKARGVRHSAVCCAILGNHADIVELLLLRTDRSAAPQHSPETLMPATSPQDASSRPTMREFKSRRNSDVLRSLDGNTRFYNASVFDKLCSDSNTRMLRLMFALDAWPVFHAKSFGLHHAISTGKLALVKLLLRHVCSPALVNLPLPHDSRGRTLIPQTNFSALTAALSHHRLDVVRHLVCDWRHRRVLVLDRCVELESLPHMLPALLFLVLDAHLQGHDVDARHLDFTCDALELLTAMDAMDVGLNWACARPLSQQRNVLVGDLRRHACRDARVLNINRTLCVGTNVAALTYKCQALWQGYRAFAAERRALQKGVARMIAILVRSGLDWRRSAWDAGARNLILRWSKESGAWSDVVDMDAQVCEDQDFVKFFRETVAGAVSAHRGEWLAAFEAFYKRDALMVDIFKWHVLDFVVPRRDVLDDIRYFQLEADDDGAEAEDE